MLCTLPTFIGTLPVEEVRSGLLQRCAEGPIIHRANRVKIRGPCTPPKLEVRRVVLRPVSRGQGRPRRQKRLPHIIRRDLHPLPPLLLPIILLVRNRGDTSSRETRSHETSSRPPTLGPSDALGQPCATITTTTPSNTAIIITNCNTNNTNNLTIATATITNTNINTISSRYDIVIRVERLKRYAARAEGNSSRYGKYITKCITVLSVYPGQRCLPSVNAKLISDAEEFPMKE